jgi:hypothetical protein
MGSLELKEIAKICTRGARQSRATKIQRPVLRTRKNFLPALERAITKLL